MASVLELGGEFSRAQQVRIVPIRSRLHVSRLLLRSARRPRASPPQCALAHCLASEALLDRGRRAALRRAGPGAQWPSWVCLASWHLRLFLPSPYPQVLLLSSPFCTRVCCFDPFSAGRVVES